MGQLTVPEADVDNDILESLDFEHEIQCEIYALVHIHQETGYPSCHGEKAEWIAWRGCTCPPATRLVCNRCKNIYQSWMAHSELICDACGRDMVFTRFERLKA